MIQKCSLIVLLILLATSIIAQTNRPTTRRQSAKQKAAEEEADRVMHRFYETLDFGVIYREMYVSDPLKRREVGTLFRAIAMRQALEKAPAPTFDFPALERAYIVVRRERYYLYFVEENNKFRLLSVTNRVQD